MEAELGTWNIKSKRSRRAPEAAFTADEYTAAESLLLLATSAGGFYHGEASSSSASKDNNPAVALCQGEAPSSSASASKENKQAVALCHLGSPSSSASKENNEAVAGATTPVMNVKKRKTLSPDTPLLAMPEYLCNCKPTNHHYCLLFDKVFQSPQALGGHMTSHRIASADSPAAASIRIHECYVCGERFPTGQALGGHMGKHYRRLPLIREARPCFDLNMPPPPEPGDDQAGDQ